MSWLNCTACGDPINTDNDVEGYQGEVTLPDGRKLDVWLCEFCRGDETRELVNETL